MSDKDMNIPAALSAWHSQLVRNLTNPDHSDPTSITPAEKSARLEFADAAVQALTPLLAATGEKGSAIIFAAQIYAELVGRVVGSAHSDTCSECIGENLKYVAKAYLGGFYLQLADQRAPTRERMDA